MPPGFKFDTFKRIKMNWELVDLMEDVKDILVKQGKKRPNTSKLIRHSIRYYCQYIIKKDKEQQEVINNEENINTSES